MATRKTNAKNGIPLRLVKEIKVSDEVENSCIFRQFKTEIILEIFNWCYFWLSGDMVSLYGAESESLENASKPKDIPIKKYCNLELHSRCVIREALNNAIGRGGHTERRHPWTQVVCLWHVRV